jgi:hypothetical protein
LSKKKSAKKKTTRFIIGNECHRSLLLFWRSACTMGAPNQFFPITQVRAMHAQFLWKPKARRKKR